MNSTITTPKKGEPTQWFCDWEGHENEIIYHDGKGGYYCECCDCECDEDDDDDSLVCDDDCCKECSDVFCDPCGIFACSNHKDKLCRCGKYKEIVKYK